MNMWKKILISTVAFTLVAGGATSALAKKPDWAGQPAWKFDDGRQKGNDRPFGKDKDKDKTYGAKGIEIEIKGKKVILTFDDVQGESAWALQYIAELVKRGVFTGYEDGTFRPNQKVTRIEAITAAVRQMGLRAQAESAEEMSTKLNFKDAGKIAEKYPWAVGYVAVAVENDLFLETDSEVKPEAPADRLWATILLVKALGLEEEAKAKMNTELTFKDKNEIPAGAVGYVAVALDKQLVTGYENNTFRPNQTVTRAELAALLDRTGDQIPGEQNGFGQVNGTFNGVSNGKVTIVKNGQSASYTVSQNVTVVRNNLLVDLDDIVVGDQVEAVVSNGVIIYLKVTTNSTGVVDGQKTGTVTAVGSGKVTVTTNGTATQYSVKNDAVIIRNGAVVALSAVKVGDQVTAVVSGGVIISLTVTTPVAENGQVSGAVTSVYSDKIELNLNGNTVKYTVDANATIVRNGAVVSLNSVQPGDAVNVILSNSKVVSIVVTTPVSDQNNGVYTVEGKYEGHRIENGKLVQFTITSQVNGNPVTRIYNVAENAAVIGDALSLEKGETTVELTVINQQVTLITIK